MGRPMNKYSYLDLAGIIFSLTGLLFVVEPFTETDALWCGVIIAGFFMWGLHARPKHGRFNLPVVFPPYIPRDVLLFWHVGVGYVGRAYDVNHGVGWYA